MGTVQQKLQTILHNVQDLAEDINTDIQTLVQSKPQEQHLPLLRQRIRALGHERKAYTLHVELGRKLAKW